VASSTIGLPMRLNGGRANSKAMAAVNMKRSSLRVSGGGSRNARIPMPRYASTMARLSTNSPHGNSMPGRMVSVSVASPRRTCSWAGRPAWYPAATRSYSRPPFTVWPLTAMMRSPARMPPRSAGWPGVTPVIRSSLSIWIPTIRSARYLRPHHWLNTSRVAKAVTRITAVMRSLWAVALPSRSMVIRFIAPTGGESTRRCRFRSVYPIDIV